MHMLQYVLVSCFFSIVEGFFSLNLTEEEEEEERLQLYGFVGDQRVSASVAIVDHTLHIFSTVRSIVSFLFPQSKHLWSLLPLCVGWYKILSGYPSTVFLF